MRYSNFGNESKKFYSRKTEEYFKEVYSSYNNGNYRAAVVTLYSVVIVDIIEKLIILDEVFDDKSANKILEDIKKQQLRDPKKPDWENVLIEKVKNQTNLIDEIDYFKISSLKTDRNLCAHPVINNDEKLYTPSYETVSSHIRNMIDSVFTKTPLLSKRILGDIVTEISNKKNILEEDLDLLNFLNAKYFNYMSTPVKVQLFKQLWKFVFVSNGQQEVYNRSLNYRFLSLLYKNYTGECDKLINSEVDYFNKIGDQRDNIRLLIKFFSDFDNLYLIIRADLKLQINEEIKNDAGAKMVSHFFSNDFITHLSEIKQNIENFFPDYIQNDAEISAYRRLIDIGFLKGYRNEVIDFITWRYEKSRNYDDADNIFHNIILNYIDKYNYNELLDLCTRISNNGQAFGRKKAKEDHKTLMSLISKKYKNFPFHSYDKVFSN